MARGRRTLSALAPAPPRPAAPGPAGVSPRFAGHSADQALAALAAEPAEVRKALGASGMAIARRLATTAPGTFMHARAVADLVATSFAGPDERAAVLLHDIGKMTSPGVFAENGGADERPPAEVLAGHVTDGLALGRRLGLTRMAMEAIAEHHGTMPVDSERRYPGPAPRSLFTATLMCADFIESLAAQGKLTPDLACRIYLSRVAHGQFSALLEPRVRANFVRMLATAIGGADSGLAERTRAVLEAPAPEFTLAGAQTAAPTREPAGGTRMARSWGSTGSGFHLYT